MTQQEAFDALNTSLEGLKTSINDASTRVANAILAGKGEQVVPVQPLLDNIAAAKSTVDAIEPVKSPTP